MVDVALRNWLDVLCVRNLHVPCQRFEHQSTIVADFIHVKIVVM